MESILIAGLVTAIPTYLTAHKKNLDESQRVFLASLSCFAFAFGCGLIDSINNVVLHSDLETRVNVVKVLVGGVLGTLVGLHPFIARNKAMN